MNQNPFNARAWSLAIITTVLFSLSAIAQTNLVSTQLRPVEEAEKMRSQILKGAPDAVNFIPEDPNTYLTRMQAELQAGAGKVHVTGALDGELSAVNAAGGLADLDDMLKRLSGSRQFSESAIYLAKMGSNNVRYIPWMQNTFQMVANKQALQYLPIGTDINAITYAQLKEWAKNIKQGTGEAKLGFPAGPKGLWHRFFQASFYPSYTGGLVRTFKSAEAEAAWADLKDLWQYVNPRSTSYGFMEEPLKTGEVWIAFDHTARLMPALNDKPGDYVTFPAPSAAKGRGFMPVIVGLAVPKNAADKAAAERLIDHLTKPAAQRALFSVGFFPSTRIEGGEMAAGAQLAASGVSATFSAKDAKASMLPTGLGAKNGEFNKVFIDTFQRIVIQNENIKKVLSEQGATLSKVIAEAKTPCWAPDASSGRDPCPVM
jgi:multiple sugar transport system substrate-binding protein